MKIKVDIFKEHKKINIATTEKDNMFFNILLQRGYIEESRDPYGIGGYSPFLLYLDKLPYLSDIEVRRTLIKDFIKNIEI